MKNQNCIENSLTGGIRDTFVMLCFFSIILIKENNIVTYFNQTYFTCEDSVYNLHDVLTILRVNNLK